MKRLPCPATAAAPSGKFIRTIATALRIHASELQLT